MRLFSLVRSATLTLAVIGFTTAAHATPITYEISGVATGQIGGTPFTGAQINLIGHSNTANIVSFDVGLPFDIFASPLSMFTITIGGVGTATILDPSGVWSFPGIVPDADDVPPVPFVLLGRIDHPPVLDSFTGIGVVGSNALTGYDLTTGIGPITDIGGIGFNPRCGIGFNDPCILTSAGFLSFSTNGIAGTQGTFTATLGPQATVPEPASIILFGTGLVAVARRRLKKRL